MLKTQQKFISANHNIFTKENNKIAYSSTDLIETYGMV